MQVFEGKNGHWMVILKKGEGVLSALTLFARQYKITGAAVSAIGAVGGVTLGFYNLEKKEYDKKEFGEQEFELLSLTGNISMVEGEHFAHLHAQLLDTEFQCTGGHLFAAKVAVTVELVVTELGLRLERQYDEETGLKLIKP